ncbi:MAG: hypothetical protein ACP5LA_06725, partial [Thermoplasmata archaeon]
TVTQPAENRMGIKLKNHHLKLIKRRKKTKIKDEEQMPKQGDHEMEHGQRKMIRYILVTNCTR